MINGLKISAQKYLEAGINVIPLTSNKTPIGAWKQFQSILNNVNGNFERAEAIGTICGAISQNLEVLDFDTKHDLSGTLWQDFLFACEIEGLDILLSTLPMVQTRSGGYHILYRCNEIEGNKKIAINKQGEAIIETRGEGGYIVAFPSPNYTLLQNDTFLVPTISKKDRERLFAVCAIFNEVVPQEPQHAGRQDQNNIDSPFLAYNKEKPSELLKSFGWTFKCSKGENEYYSRPNSKSHDVHGSLRQINDTWIFYSFSSNCYPLEPNKGYNPTALYSLFTGKTDKKEIVRDFVSMGFGSFAKKETKSEAKEKNKEGCKNEAFPFDVFPQGIQDLIEEYSTKRDFSRVLLANSILCVFSGAVGMNYEYKLSNGWAGFSNLYMALVGRASISKSPTMNFALSPIFEVEKEWNSKYRQANSDYETLSKADKKSNFVEPKPTRQRILLNDATMEAVIKIHSANEKGLILFRDELIGWLRSFNGYKGGKGSDQQNYLQIWDNGVVLNDRAGRETEQFLPQSYVSVFGGIQPKVLGELAKDSRLDDGFILRFLFCFAEEKEHPALWADICDKTDVKLYEEYKNAVKYYALQSFLAEPKTLLFSKEAELLWANFYDANRLEVLKQNNDDFSSLITKLEKYTTRLALLLQLIHNVYSGDVENYTIGVECMKGALKMIEYYKDTANKALGIIEETKDFDAPTTATIDWRKIFVDSDCLPTGEIVCQIQEKFGKSERTAKALIAKELTKVSHGIWRL
jgi:Protein of unknown function (DUF3987)/Bifunctional DNA primase/polymerase, N-terminal